MNTVTKTLVGTAVAGAMAVSSASPAVARDHDRIDAGEVIAGAVILGGLAAVLSSSKRDRYRDRDYRDDRYYDRRGYRDRDYHRGERRIGKRRAIEKCVRGAERQAIRYGARRADVTDIRDVERTRYGWKVKGRIAAKSRYYGRDNRWRDGWGRDYRGYDNRQHRGWDSGKFTCRVNYGRVEQVRFKGLRI